MHACEIIQRANKPRSMFSHSESITMFKSKALSHLFCSSGFWEDFEPVRLKERKRRYFHIYFIVSIRA